MTKRLISILMLLMMVAGLAIAEETELPPDTDGHTESYMLLEEITTIDQDQPIDDYNAAIIALCDEHKTTIFEILSIVSGEIGIDDPLYPFMSGSIQHTSADLFGEPYADAFAIRMSQAGKSDEDMKTTIQGMNRGEILSYIMDNNEQIENLAIASYFIHFEVTDPATYTVTQREMKINSVQQAVQDFADGLTWEQLGAKDTEAMFETELARLSDQMTENDIKVWLEMSILDRPYVEETP